jgi:hypothetical protein
MGLWQRIEQALWTGKVLKDYGTLSEGWYGGAKRRVSALLAHKSNRDQFVIRTSLKALFGASLGYVELDRDAALKLKEALEDALGQMR